MKLLLEHNTILVYETKSLYSYLSYAGRNLFPATGYLHLVWESLALMRNETPEGYSVIFENVKFLRATNIPTGAENLQLIVMIQRGTGNFEV